MPLLPSLLRILLLTLLATKITQCLKCLQCVSYKDQSCKEGTASPKECPYTNQTYCITYSGRLPGARSQPVLIRGCSAANMSEKCHEKEKVNGSKSGGKPMEIIMCYTTCRHDGCNTDFHDFSGTAVSLTVGVPYISAFTLAVIIVSSIQSSVQPVLTIIEFSCLFFL